MPRWTDSSWPKSARNLLGYAASASVLEAKPDVSSPQLKTWIAEWRRRARERRELSELNECDRRDLGISRCDAQTEARKPFWRPVAPTTGSTLWLCAHYKAPCSACPGALRAFFG